MANKKSNSSGLVPQSTTPGEWGVAGLGLLIVATTIAYLTYHSVRYSDEIPMIMVEAGSAEPVMNGFHVSFSARNHSSATAAEVRIEGALREGNVVVERSMAKLDYLPGHSERMGGLFFRRDPRLGQMQIYATGYQQP